jgi:hypothetical protein
LTTVPDIDLSKNDYNHKLACLANNKCEKFVFTHVNPLEIKYVKKVTTLQKLSKIVFRIEMHNCIVVVHPGRFINFFLKNKLLLTSDRIKISRATNTENKDTDGDCLQIYCTQYHNFIINEFDFICNGLQLVLSTLRWSVVSCIF